MVDLLFYLLIIVSVLVALVPNLKAKLGLVGALVLGITQQVGFHVDPGWGLWFGHLVFLLVLVLRPQGLFPKTRG